MMMVQRIHSKVVPRRYNTPFFHTLGRSRLTGHERWKMPCPKTGWLWWIKSFNPYGMHLLKLQWPMDMTNEHLEKGWWQRWWWWWYSQCVHSELTGSIRMDCTCCNCCDCENSRANSSEWVDSTNGRGVNVCCWSTYIKQLYARIVTRRNIRIIKRGFVIRRLS